jgi:hypothetical protein
MTPRPLDHPRRVGPHVAAAINQLQRIRCTDIRVYRTKHVRIRFKAGPHQLVVFTTCTPKDADYEAKRVLSAIAHEIAELHKRLGYG